MLYLYEEPVEIENLTLQKSEVSEVIWIDYTECSRKIRENEFRHCIYTDEFEMLGKALGLIG